MDFENLTQQWSSMDNVYGSGCQLVGTSPSSIFETSFANQQDHFLVAPNESCSKSPELIIDSWSDQPTDHQTKFFAIKKRTICVESLGSSFAFFLKKEGKKTSRVTQTAFFGTDSLTIYSVSKISGRNKEDHHTLINRMTIKSQSENKVALSINVNCHQCKAMVKSKWLKFYQSHFKSWKQWMEDEIKKQKDEEQKKAVMAPYIGIWNKLNSQHSIRITFDKIEYSDGSTFNVSVNTENVTPILVAKYARTEYAGKIMKHDQYEEIKWDNGSIWIRDGFARFSGTYTAGNEQWVIHKFGTIKLPVTGKRVRFRMTAPNRIRYVIDDHHCDGTLSDDGSGIQWDDGNFWTRDHGKEEAGCIVECTVQQQPENESDAVCKKKKVGAMTSASNADAAEEEVTVDRLEKALDGSVDSGASVVDDTQLHPDTLTVRNVGEQEEDGIALESDFEDNFNHYFSCHGGAASLQIEKEDHFVVVDDDALYGVQTLSKVDPDHADEWLLI